MKSPRQPPIFATMSENPQDTNSCCLSRNLCFSIHNHNSQFKSPRHHEDDHLSIFGQAPIWTLGVIVGPWGNQERLHRHPREVARIIWDPRQCSFQEFIPQKQLKRLSANIYLCGNQCSGAPWVTPYPLLCYSPFYLYKRKLLLNFPLRRYLPRAGWHNL